MSNAASFDFSGAKVLVTGGSNGIGAAISKAFADAGADVVITGTRASASEYDGDLSAYKYRQLELTDKTAIEALAASLDGLDILVNNAGGNFPGGKHEAVPDVFEESVAINLFGAYRL
ncbi:MAG: SDR family oxidoreductase, partial [Deltaproteobacteria bacterium]|nr:SDR family oxidoreductase [Deltaproteobacteria bacterium]MBW2687221.1 SDR family oxidoreductase [Deltaproteobacteria bacterium]